MAAARGTTAEEAMGFLRERRVKGVGVADMAGRLARAIEARDAKGGVGKGQR